MAEEESIFDPTLKKKKKKKKTAFDIDAALAEGNMPDKNETKEAEIDDGNLDLESFGKKKKKKKKPFNMEELDGALPDSGSKSKDEGTMEIDGNQDETLVEYEATVQEYRTKSAKTGEQNWLCRIHINKEIESLNDVEVSQTAWFGQDRDYTYDELLTRVFDIMRDKNPDMVAGKKQKFVMRPPQVVRIGTKKTSFANFTEICKTLHRQPKHLLDFLLAELGTSGSVDGNNQLIIKGRFQQKQIENVLRRYIKEYVTCHTCRSPDTILQKDTRLFFLQCETCGSRCSVASIKSGFQAVTGKRAAIRAKTA
ncbi:hypothetical protein L9F63_004421 [Diploptera punctata]|uniref:Eukaryotic translation initiation factor 2 subunit 2 n=1 Tax=Diploptera punctata TaxID=6984 RepID=A0AAD7ZG50_DIPPU|nr:hypothetical protein L9F63_004421 [Diploptera punctata]